MISVGLDLSLTGTGVVVLNGDEVDHQKLLKSKPLGDRPVDEASRLSTLANSIDKEVPDEADIVVIEGIAFMARNTSAIAQLAALNYMVRERLMKRGINFVIAMPTTLKKWITGKGVGPKDIMMLEIYKKYGFCCDNNNIADAFGLAKIGQGVIEEDMSNEYKREIIKSLKKQL